MGKTCGKDRVAEPVSIVPKQLPIRQSDMIRKVLDRDVKDDYKFLAVLGEGSYGEVKRAIHKITNIERAVKVVRRNNLSKDTEQKLLKEVDLLREMDHPNALKIIEYYDDPYSFYIVVEIYSGGTLSERWLKGGKFTEIQIAQFMKDILRCVNYMHSKGITHRDIKPENIMFATDDPDSILKVVDFGAASVFQKNIKLQQTKGTVAYMAPEVLEKNYNEKCDIWSCGVVLYMLLSGKLPFEGHNEEVLIKKIKRAEVSVKKVAFEKASEEAKDLILKMMEKDPARRFSAQQCLEHPWFDKMLQELHLEKNIDAEIMETLASFRGMSLLKNAFWAFLISYFSTYEEKYKIIKTWTALDWKGRGMLTKDDLRRGFELGYKGKSVIDIDKVFDALDFNKSGYIEYTGFLNAAFDKESFLNNTKLEMMFKIWDQDADGFLTVQELKDFLTPNPKLGTDAEYGDLILYVHNEFDGKVSLADFKSTIKKYFNWIVV